MASHYRRTAMAPAISYPADRNHVPLWWQALNAEAKRREMSNTDFVHDLFQNYLDDQKLAQMWAKQGGASAGVRSKPPVELAG